MDQAKAPSIASSEHIVSPLCTQARDYVDRCHLLIALLESGGQSLIESMKQLWLERFLLCVEEGILLPSWCVALGPLDSAESAVSLAGQ